MGGFEWKAFKGKASIPKNAVVAGSEGETTVYVCRAKLENSILPGKYLKGQPFAMIPFHGTEHFVKEYELLLADPGTAHWVPTSGANYPAGSLVTGWCQDHNTTHYIGRVYTNGVITAGKVLIDKCIIAHFGKELMFDDYEILVIS